MKKKETRELELIITYCDYCGKEILEGYASIENKEGVELNFCLDYSSKTCETCLDKYKKEKNK